MNEALKIEHKNQTTQCDVIYEKCLPEKKPVDDYIVEALQAVKNSSNDPGGKKIPIESKVKMLIDIKDRKVAHSLAKNKKYQKGFEKIFLYSSDPKVKNEGAVGDITERMKESSQKNEINNQLKANLTGEILASLKDKMSRMYFYS